jgi:hypothetical protein
MFTTIRKASEAMSISGVKIPDSKLAHDATELVRDTEPALLFNHSTRVFYFGSLAGKDWETGPVITFSHRWPLNADAWDAQMLFLG